MKREEGFTLVELLFTMALLSILLTLGITALRYFWFGQALYNQRDEVYTNLRALQQQVVSESNPVVVAAWFKVTPANAADTAPQWGTVRLRPDLNPITCTRVSDRQLTSGVKVKSATFADSLAGVSNMGDLISACRSQVPASATATDFVFFLARGTATAGCVTLTQPRRTMADQTILVSTLTGRIERIAPEEVGARCP